MDRKQEVVDLTEEEKRGGSSDEDRRQKENPFKVKAVWLILPLCVREFRFSVEFKLH